MGANQRFKRAKCSACGTHRDSTFNFCPKCNKENNLLSDMVNPLECMDWGRCLKMVLLLFAAQFGVMIVFYMAAIFIVGGSIAETAQRLSDDIKLISWSSFAGTIAGIFVGMFILRDYLKPLIKSAKKKYFIMGAVIGAVIFGIGTIYEMLLDFGTNENQMLLVEEFQASPVIFVISVSILAPIFEELVFRTGVYGFFRKINRPLAYIISTLAFAMIHVDLGAANITAELVSLPAYLLPGFALAFAYDKYGFWGSFTMHLTNNSIAAIMFAIEM